MKTKKRIVPKVPKEMRYQYPNYNNPLGDLLIILFGALFLFIILIGLLIQI